jgi:hypothetical protein
MAVLTVPEDSVWHEWPVSGMKTIYVPGCYSRIYSKCQFAWQRECRLVVVKGTPGVGKSVFLDYVLSQLLSATGVPVRVMVVRGPSDDVLLYRNGYSEQPEEVSLQVARSNKLANDADYVLYDPHEDPLETQKLNMAFFCKKNVLIAMSPDPQNCKKILKDASRKQVLYMGPMDVNEAEAMRTSCYANSVSAEQLTQRFEQAGGVPRLLFQESAPDPPEGFNDSVLKEISDSQTFALKDFVLNPQRIDCGSVSSEFKGLWSLYHLVPNEEFNNYQIEVCCDNALKLLRDHMLKMDVQKLWALFKETDTRLGTLRGIRFEAYAHQKILVDGINLTARKLTKNAVSATVMKTIFIPSGSTKFPLRDNTVETLPEQRQEAYKNGGGYLLPDFSNYPVIDSAFVSWSNECYMLQMKSGNSKRLSPDKAEIVAAALGNVFVIVTPEENIVKTMLAGSPPGVIQYVLILQESR